MYALEKIAIEGDFCCVNFDLVEYSDCSLTGGRHIAFLSILTIGIHYNLHHFINNLQTNITDYGLIVSIATLKETASPANMNE